MEKLCWRKRKESNAGENADEVGSGGKRERSLASKVKHPLLEQNVWGSIPGMINPTRNGAGGVVDKCELTEMVTAGAAPEQEMVPS